MLRLSTTCVLALVIVGAVLLSCCQPSLARIDIANMAKRNTLLRQQQAETQQLSQNQAQAETQGQTQEESQTTKTSQGVVTTHTMEFKSKDRRVGQQENVYDDAGDKNGGGTSVILSNLNSVENWEDNRIERDLAVESAKKRGEEQRHKEDFSNTQREQSAKERQEADNQSKMRSKQLMEDKQKKIEEAQHKRAAEHKEKRQQREEQSEKKSKQRQEETQKRIDATEKEEKDKRDQRDEQDNKRQKAKEEDEKASLRLAAWRLSANQRLRENSDLVWNGAYTYMFFIRPVGVYGDWGNIMHKGQENHFRNPAVWFYPGSLSLHVRSGVNYPTSDWSRGNEGCDPGHALTLNTWTHFALIHDGSGMRVYLDGQNYCNANLGAPLRNDGPLYASDPWHAAAQADLADFRYYPRAVEFSIIQQAMRDRRGL